jgi:hypothetical protein
VNPQLKQLLNFLLEKMKISTELDRSEVFSILKLKYCHRCGREQSDTYTRGCSCWDDE